MSLVDANTRVVVQGITGRAASHHVENMLAYGTQIVAGVRPGAEGKVVHGVPVYHRVKDAVTQHGANTSILFIPAKFMKEAAFEAIDAQVKSLVMVSEHVPIHDAMAIFEYARIHGVDVIGPNTPGLIAPPLKIKVGFLPSQYFKEGPVAIASRSGTLTYELVSRLTQANLGQSLCVGVGGDRMVGTPFRKMLEHFEKDPHTKVIGLIGEIGGVMEEEAAAMVQRGAITKPVVAYIAGRNAPEGKRMGHAGAIVSGGRGSIQSKLEAFARASIPVAETLADFPKLVAQVLSELNA